MNIRECGINTLHTLLIGAENVRPPDPALMMTITTAASPTGGSRLLFE